VGDATKLITRWIIAAALLCLVARVASAASMLGSPGGGLPVTPPSYTPLCGGSNPTCAYAYSTERQMASTATAAFQVERSVDSTTQDVGFIGSGVNTGFVNTATVDGFCNASVGGVISRNCFISILYDQSGNACPIFATSVANMPDYIVDPGHQGLPRFQKVWQGSGALTFLLDSGGAISGTPTHHCAALTGPSQSLFFAGNSLYTAFSSGQFGLMEGTVASGPQGAMFAAFVGPTGPYTYDHCVINLPCGGMDTEAQGPQQNYTRTSNDDFIVITAAPASGTSPWNIYINNNLAFPNDNSTVSALVTGFRMTWGNSGDHSTPGPAIGRSESFYTSILSSGQVAALYSNETGFTGGLTTGYEGPGDSQVVGNETSYSSGLTSQKVVQLQWLSQAFSLRKAYASYEGPSLNVCKGSGACEDIGWVNNVFDTATASAYCGPVSGLNNCAVQVWYNEALNQAATTNGVNTGIDATAISSSNRPALLFSGCGTTTITVCVSTTTTNYFTLGGGVTVHGGYTMSAVATRTGGTGSQSAILSSVTATSFIGFAAAANTCLGMASSGGTASTVACNDNAVHSITVDAHTSPSASIITDVDGTAGTTSTSTVAYDATGAGVGATAAGLDPCTCQLSEVLVYADATNTSFNTALGPTGVAALRANQRAAFGF
jgi:hypothetical protein